MKYYLILLIISLSLINCSHDQASNKSFKTIGDRVETVYEESEPQMTSASVDQEAPAIPESNQVQIQESQIIKSGDLKFEVDKIKASKSKVDTLLNNLNGYYENEQYSSYGSRNAYHLRIRIPNKNFDNLIDQLENGTGKLISKSINAQDVTEEFVDLNIRLESNLAYLNQYKEILKKAKTIKEILEVQEKIRRITSEIDSKKGRIKYLSDRVQYSSLNLELTEKIDTPIYEDSFASRMVNAFQNGFKAFLNFLVILMNLWPFILLILIAWFFRKKVWQLFKRNKKSKD